MLESDMKGKVRWDLSKHKKILNLRYMSRLSDNNHLRNHIECKNSGYYKKDNQWNNQEKHFKLDIESSIKYVIYSL